MVDTCLSWMTITTFLWVSSIAFASAVVILKDSPPVRPLILGTYLGFSILFAVMATVTAFLGWRMIQRDLVLARRHEADASTDADPS